MIKGKNILITGSRGQLGTELVHEFSVHNNVIPADRNTFDVSDHDRTVEFIKKAEPDIIIHSAAFKDVDACETDHATAKAVNIEGTANVAEAARSADACMVYVSTDYVFDGNKEKPYTESDDPAPVNYYGISKLKGEEIVKDKLSKYYIIRTSWLFGVHGDNFVKSMLKHANEKSELNIVKDKFASPTSTADLSRQIDTLIESGSYGTYHCTSQGGCNWYEYAVKIFEYAGINVGINPIPISEFPFIARRPLYTVLDNLALRSSGIDIMPHWEDSLKDFMGKLRDTF